MFPRVVLFFFFLLMKLIVATTEENNFIYNGFKGASLHLDGLAEITSNGLLRLTNTSDYLKGHAFCSSPLLFKNSSTAFGTQYLGLFNNSTNNGDPSNQIVAVELDTFFNTEFGDIDNNHVGIDVNSLKSINSSHASYFTNENGGGFKNLSLISGEPMQVWVEYDHLDGLFNVTLAPLDVPKPSVPLLSSYVNLSSVISDYMFVGFSSSMGSLPTSHYILGWSFKLNGKALALDLSHLPSLPRRGPKPKPMILIIGSPILALVLVLTTITTGAFMVRRKIKFAELHEEWELEYGPQRFSYKNLFMATKGFRDKELVGAGGFGSVYKGVLPNSSIQVAVKKVSHESRQGMKEFIAEIISIGRLRHRNLVQLLGYCRRKGELLLVYDFMPNGSLDKYLFDQPKSMLNWGQRFQIIRGVASGLSYLHEGWEQVVVHRDIKASNILLDGELNGRLGDFGLARLYDHGTDHQTTHIVGTLGYLAPELPRTGKATTCTDVYAFGSFLLEVACGRRPIETQASADEIILVDRVLQLWKGGAILAARDPNLGDDYVAEEMELVLKLGLHCSHPMPASRPRMWLVVQVLDGIAPLPEMSEEGWDADASDLGYEGFVDCVVSDNMFARSTSTIDSVILEGR